MNLVLIKYNAGNIFSVITALERLGVKAMVTDDAAAIRTADKIIFPGVGEAGSAMQSLRENGLDEVIKSLTQPVLGICVGMQLLCNHSEESDTECLGIVPIEVKRFVSTVQPSLASASPLYSSAGLVEPKAPEGPGVRLKVPQVGWNTIHHLRSPLFDGVNEGSYIYNVHSYYAEDSAYSIATCEYGLSYAAAIRKNNFYGVQFHTEKSADTGDQIIRNFLAL